MTALEEYQRLESTGIWRPAPEAQRRDVIVSLGDATLTISDHRDSALSHWSLPAVHRLNPGERPALFAPGRDSDEVLELTDEDLIGALGKVRRAIERRRPHHGRLRLATSLMLFTGLLAGGVFWLPDALVSYTARVVPEVTRAAIGARLEERVHRVAGETCTETLGLSALDRLRARVLGSDSKARLVVLADAPFQATHLPGRIILLSRELVENQDGPEAVAGFVLAEDERARQNDPVVALLHEAGLAGTLRLLTTGALADRVLDRYGESLLSTGPAPLADGDLLARFSQAGFTAQPYAFARDPTGESVLGLIEADPVPLARSRPPLTDGQWISLQQICVE